MPDPTKKPWEQNLTVEEFTAEKKPWERNLQTDDVKKKVGTQPTGASTTPPQKLVSETSIGSSGGVDSKINPFNGFSNTDLSGFKDKTAKPVINNKLVQQINPNAIKEKQLKTYLTNTKVTPENMDEVTAKTNELLVIKKTQAKKSLDEHNRVLNPLWAKANTIDKVKQEKDYNDEENDNQFSDKLREFGKKIGTPIGSYINEVALKPINQALSLGQTSIDDIDNNKGVLPLFQDEYKPKIPFQKEKQEVDNNIREIQKKSPSYNPTVEEKNKMVKDLKYKNLANEQIAKNTAKIASELQGVTGILNDDDAEILNSLKSKTIEKIENVSDVGKGISYQIQMIEAQSNPLRELVEQDRKYIKSGSASEQEVVDWNKKNSELQSYRDKYEDLLGQQLASNKDKMSATAQLQQVKLDHSFIGKIADDVIGSFGGAVGGLSYLVGSGLNKLSDVFTGYSPNENTPINGLQKAGDILLKDAKLRAESHLQYTSDDILEHPLGWAGQTAATLLPYIASDGTVGLSANVAKSTIVKNALFATARAGENLYNINQEELLDPSIQYSNAQKLGSMGFHAVAELAMLGGVNRITKAFKPSLEIMKPFEKEIFDKGLKGFVINAVNKSGNFIKEANKSGVTFATVEGIKMLSDNKILGKKVENFSDNLINGYKEGFILGGTTSGISAVVNTSKYLAEKVMPNQTLAEIKNNNGKIFKHQTELENKDLTADEVQSVKNKIVDLESINQKLYSEKLNNARKFTPIQIKELLTIDQDKFAIRNKTEEIKKGNFSNDYKKSALAELKTDFNDLENRRESVFNKESNSIDLLEPKERKRLMNDAEQNLQNRLNPNREKVLYLKPEEIEKEAVSIHLKKIKDQQKLQDAETQSTVTNEAQLEAEVQEPIVSKQAEIIQPILVQEAKVESVVAPSVPELDIKIERGGIFSGDFLNDFDFLAEGSEHSVYKSKDGKTVIKIGEPYNSNESYQARVDDALAINNLLGDGSLEVVGTYKSPNGTLNPVYKQNFTDGKTATQEQVAEHLINNGFTQTGKDTFTINKDGKTLEISDTSDNFIINSDENIIAIDASIKEIKNEGTPQTNTPIDRNLPIGDNTDLQQGQVEAVQSTSNVGESKNNVEVEYNGVVYSKNKDGNWVNTKTNNEIKGIGEKGKELIKILDNKSTISSNQTKGTEASGKTDQREGKHTKIGLTFDAYQDFYKKVAEMPNKDSILGEYQSGETIKKVTGSEPTNDQTYEGVDFQTQINHGQNVLENAKEVFGNEYVEKTLDFLQDSNLDGFSKAVVYSALERNLDAMLKANPTDASILALQKLVYADSQANLRIGSLIVNSGRLRAFAKGLEEGFDREPITNTVFTPKQKEAKVVLESLTPNGEGANKAQEDKYIEEQEQLKYTQKDFDEELKKELQKAQQSTGAGAKARELASKIREKGVLPDWLKASDAQQQFIKDNDVKNNGININEAFAKALETFADLHDATNNFKESVKEAFSHIRDWHNENKLKFNEDEYLKNFAETVRIKDKGNRAVSDATKRKIYVNMLNKHNEALDVQIESRKAKEPTIKQDKYQNDKEIQELKKLKKEKQDKLAEIDPDSKIGKVGAKKKQNEAIKIVKQALIDYNNGEFTHTVKRNGEETKVLDWTKIIGRANDPKNIKIAVEKVLENQNFSQSEKNRLSEALEKEYDDLSERNIKKANDDLVRKNLVKPNVVTKTDIERLVQYQNQGLLGENAKNYERLINKIVGLTDVEQTTLDKINEEVEKIKNIYATEIGGKRFDKNTLRSKENEVTNRIKKIISLSNFSNSPASLKGIKALSELAGLSRKAVLGNLYNSIQNIYSGVRQTVLSDIKGRALGYTTPELRKVINENLIAIGKDMMSNKGLDYGETVSPFTSHTIISDLAKDKIADIFGRDKTGRIAQGAYNVAEGHLFLNVADSVFKSRIVAIDFVMNTVDILTANRKGHQKMTKAKAVEFVSNALTGVNLENAKVTAKKFIDAVNEKQPNTIEDNEFSVTRFANEIVRENLLSGNHLTIEEINDSFNSAYYSGGKNIGHEANNIITKQVNFLNNYIDTKEQDALKEKEYGTALMYGTLGLVQKNIVNPFVGGGMNWAVLEAEAGLPVVGVVAAIAKKGNFNLKANELDLETQTGINNRKKQLQERREVESTLLRGLWGTAVSTATFLTYSVITGNSGVSDDDDENKRKFNQYLKENPEQKKIFTKFAPDVLAYTLAYNDEKLSKVILQKIGSRSDDNIVSLIKTIQDPNKSTAGAFGELAGALFSTPFAWRVFRDSQRLYHELKGDPLNQTQFKTTSFWNGYYKGAFVDWLGYRPEVNYDFNKMSKKLDLEKEKFTKETNDIANDIVDKKITELEANKILKTKYGNDSKKLGKAINIIKDAYQDKDIRTKLEGADYWFMEFYKEKDINKKAILYSQKCLKQGFKADAEFNKNMALVLADFSNEKFQNLKDLAIEIKDYEASLNKKK